MNEEYDVYVEFIKSILKKVGIVKLSYLKLILRNSFEELKSDDAKINDILLYMQRWGYLLISHEGFVVTKLFYKQMSDDRFYDGVNRKNTCFLGDEFPKYGYHKNADGEEERYVERQSTVKEFLVKNKPIKNVVESTLVLACYMPNSKDFVLCASPWTVAFEQEIEVEKENEEDSGIATEVVFIGRLTSGDINSKMALMKVNEKIDKEERKFNHRILLLESPDILYKVKKYGFREIYCYQNNKLELLEERSEEDAWSDYD